MLVEPTLLLICGVSQTKLGGLGGLGRLVWITHILRPFPLQHDFIQVRSRQSQWRGRLGAKVKLWTSFYFTTKHSRTPGIAR